MSLTRTAWGVSMSRLALAFALVTVAACSAEPAATVGPSLAAGLGTNRSAR